MKFEPLKILIVACIFLIELSACSGGRNPLTTRGGADNGAPRVVPDPSNDPSPTPTPTPTPAVAPLGFTYKLKPKFIWNAVPGAVNYELSVEDLINDLTVPGIPLITATTWTSPVAFSEGSYRWSVTAIGPNDVRGVPSNPIDFQVRVGLAVLLTPTGSITNRRPTFSWNPVEGAVHYEFWLDHLKPYLQGVIKIYNLTSLTYTPTADLSLGEHQWFIRAVSANGKFGPWNAPVLFQIAN